MADNDQKMVPESDLLRVKTARESAESRANSLDTRLTELTTEFGTTKLELDELRAWKAGNEPKVTQVSQLETDLASSTELVKGYEGRVMTMVKAAAISLGISESALEGKTVNEIELITTGAKMAKGESDGDGDPPPVVDGDPPPAEGDGTPKDEDGTPPPVGEVGINVAKVGGDPTKSAVAQSRYFVGATGGTGGAAPVTDREYANSMRERSNARQADQAVSKP